VTSSTNKIARRFDDAASHYDQQASVQAQVAQRLVDDASLLRGPGNILDLGCGTGFVAEAVRKKWPQASITALDHAPAMLEQVRRKLPNTKIIIGDAAQAEFAPQFDIIFSSMMLHWLPQPRVALKRWQGWLKPGGKTCTALLIDGSFQEWRDLCGKAGIKDGLWVMPHDNFADGLSARSTIHTLKITYPSAQFFLRRLKSTGTATPRPGHTPENPAVLRRLLRKAPQPFTTTYRVLYLEI